MTNSRDGLTVCAGKAARSDCQAKIDNMRIAARRVIFNRGMIITVPERWRAGISAKLCSRPVQERSHPSDLFLCRRKKIETFRRVRCLMIRNPT
jgi:hypothetical protein